jgi:PAS domain S-box-containing protein
MADMLGYTTEELNDKSIFDLMNPEGRKITRTHIEWRDRDDSEQHFIKMKKKTGEDVWTSISLKPLYERKKNYVGTMVQVTNVTQRKQAEAQIRKLSSAVDQSASIIIITDTNGRIDYVNPKFTEVTGYTTKEVFGKNPRILKGNKTSKEEYKKLWETISSGGEWRGELHNKKKDSSYYWAYASMSPIKNQEGTITHFLGVQEDVTERKIAEIDLKRYSEELERSNQELQQFAYVASHDLQEPLRMISSYMTLLKKRYNGKLDQDAEDFIDFAVDGSKRMKQLINDLLQYSRVGTHGKPFSLIDMETVLDKSLFNLQVSIKENQAVITHDPLPKVFGDDIQLTQLFQNLIGNAIKFRGKRKPEIHINSKTENGDYIFSVQDKGIGIEKEFLNRIFEIFQRLHRSSEYEGTGIGLALCKKIIARHKGKIWVESEHGKGSTFYFSIPVNKEVNNGKEESI